MQGGEQVDAVDLLRSRLILAVRLRIKIVQVTMIGAVVIKLAVPPVDRGFHTAHGTGIARVCRAYHVFAATMPLVQFVRFRPCFHHWLRDSKQPNKSRQINRWDVRGLDGFRRLGILFFIHGLSCRCPAVSALGRSIPAQ